MRGMNSNFWPKMRWWISEQYMIRGMAMVM